MKVVKQIALSTVLAGLFLSAGAFAQSDISNVTQIKSHNVTVIHKTSAFPRIITIRSCAAVKCVEA
jgi:hypothetical protein